MVTCTLLYVCGLYALVCVAHAQTVHVRTFCRYMQCMLVLRHSSVHQMIPGSFHFYFNRIQTQCLSVLLLSATHSWTIHEPECAPLSFRTDVACPVEFPYLSVLTMTSGCQGKGMFLLSWLDQALDLPPLEHSFRREVRTFSSITVVSLALCVLLKTALTVPAT